MNDFVSRIFAPKGTDESGSKMAPEPVTRSDSTITDAEAKRRKAAAVRMGFGSTRLTSLGESQPQGKTSLVGNIGSTG